MLDRNRNMDTILGMHFAGERLSVEQEELLVQWVMAHKEEYEKLSKFDIRRIDSKKAWANLQAQLTENHAEKNSLKKTNWRDTHLKSILSIAASILVVIGISLFWWEPSEKDVLFANAGTNIETVLLPDSSTVMLYPSSNIRYSSNKANNHIRRVSLTGKAFFKVKRDVQKPFVVESATSEIKVLGTSFLVANSESSQQTNVFVKEGRVQVSTSSANVRLAANECASVQDGTIDKSKILHPEIIFRDQIKQIDYQNSPIEQILHDMEDEFKINITIDETLRSNRISTQLTFDNPEDMLAELSFICNCKFKKISDNKYKLYLP